MKKHVNAYSRQWFELFLENRAYTDLELAFIRNQLPNPPFSKVLDVCCGQGRHSNWLGEMGYSLLGIDLDQTALAIAKQTAPSNVRYQHLDMRQLAQMNEQFDAVLLMWQSFGYFDEATNANILRQISDCLRENGRFILDIYNRSFWQDHQGERTFERNGLTIINRNTMEGNRLTSHLIYDPNNEESFEWQLYELEEIKTLASQYGLHLLLSCTLFGPSKPVQADSMSMQLVFEKRQST